MGMFDYLRCEMPLPAPAPPAETQFQTKDTPEQYLEPYRITADGRLVYEKRERVREADPNATDALARLGTLRTIGTEDVELDYHGDIGFGHFDHRSGEDWDYVARFTEGRCVRIWLEEHRPPERAPVEITVSEMMPPSERIAALKQAGFVFHPGRDQPDNASLNGPHEAIRNPGRNTITYRMWLPIAASPPSASPALVR